MHRYIFVLLFLPYYLFILDLKLVCLINDNWNFIVIWTEQYQWDLQFGGRMNVGLKGCDLLTLYPDVSCHMCYATVTSMHSLSLGMVSYFS